MCDNLSRRRSVVDHLRGSFRDEFLNPDYVYHLVYDVEKARDAGYFVDNGPDRRLDGRRDSERLPAPLEFATIGTNFRTATHVHAIGIDIDGDTHAAGHDAATLARIRSSLERVAWLELRASRSGSGLHAFAFLAAPIPAADNPAVSPLGSALVQRIAEEIGEPDFPSYIDKAGSIMFIAGGKQKLIKPAAQLFTETLEPYYPAPASVEVDATELDDEHQRVVDWLTSNRKKDFAQDGTLFHAHTTDLATAHVALNLRGEFATVATGTGDAKYNCFVRALPGGAWLVGQWGNNQAAWSESKRGYRFTILNPTTTLDDFAAECGVAASKGGYCLSPDEAADFCKAIGETFPGTGSDFVTVTESPDQIRFDIDIKPSTEVVAPWRRASKLKAYYVIRRQQREKQLDLSEIVRVTYSESGRGIMPFRKLHGRYWQQTTIEDAQAKLSTLGLDRQAINKYLTTDTPNEIVNEPFRPEMLSKYKWNRGAVQLAYEPEPGLYPHWQKTLDHCGRGLDVSHDQWCIDHGIKTGADYLKLWFARLFREPKRRLPALSFISIEQNCGKSTLPASHGMLMTRGGYVLAEKALTTNFTWPLLGALLCDLDDVDLSQRDGVYQKLQPLLTNDEMVIEGKGSNVLQVANTTHWIHSANRPECCPVQPGDTRFVVIEVAPLEEEIPAATFTRALVREAPHYLQALFDLPMPEEAGRLYLPVVDTPIKDRLMASRIVLTPQQTVWLKQLKSMANEGKLNTLTTLDGLMLDDARPRSFAAVWPKLATMLEDAGYVVANRSNNGGKVPAAWSVKRAA